MAEDYHAWLRRKEDEQIAKRVAAIPTPAPAKGGGFGAESTFANTPATEEDKGLLTRFGSRSGVKSIDVGGNVGGIGETSTEGGAKTITVGEPIKTEPLMKPLSELESV